MGARTAFRWPKSLRRHDPDQVLRVSEFASQPGKLAFAIFQASRLSQNRYPLLRDLLFGHPGEQPMT